MTLWHLEIRVVPRPGLLDPEGKAIQHALHSLDYEGIQNVRVGKLLYLDIEAPSEEEARKQGEDMCHHILANPVMEDFDIEAHRVIEEQKKL